MTKSNELLENLNLLHTTSMGEERIRRNLGLGTEIKDLIDWCRKKIDSQEVDITRKGKNWYCSIDNCIITVNAYSYTIITAHKKIQ